MGRDGIKHETIVGDQHHGTGEIIETLFQYFQGGNIEIVGGLIENEKVGGLPHQIGYKNASLFAAR